MVCNLQYLCGCHQNGRTVTAMRRRLDRPPSLPREHTPAAERAVSAIGRRGGEPTGMPARSTAFFEIFELYIAKQALNPRIFSRIFLNMNFLLIAFQFCGFLCYFCQLTDPPFSSKIKLTWSTEAGQGSYSTRQDRKLRSSGALQSECTAT